MKPTIRKFWRFFKKMYYKLIRTRGSPYSIAMGVATGLFSGVIIPFGQFIPALLFAWIMKGNKLISIAATFITNPYTTPFLYPFMCLLGAKIIGVSLTVRDMHMMYRSLTTSFSWSKLVHIGGDILLSYSVGALIVGLFMAFSGYIITYRLIIMSRERRAKKMREKREKAAIRDGQVF